MSYRKSPHDSERCPSPAESVELLGPQNLLKGPQSFSSIPPACTKTSLVQNKGSTGEMLESRAFVREDVWVSR